jgi:hypothetical protein
MSDTQATSTDLTLAQVSAQVQADADLVKQAAALAQAKDWVKLGELALKNRSTIEKQVEQVSTLVPLVKAGWKTSEFWLVTAYLGINIYCMLKGQPLPFADDTTLGGVIAAYTGGRHLIKNTQSK